MRQKNRLGSSLQICVKSSCFDVSISKTHRLSEQTKISQFGDFVKCKPYMEKLIYRFLANLTGF